MSGRSALADYRDDGPLATLLGRTAGRRIRLDAVLLTGAGILPVAVVAALPNGGSRPALGASVGWLLVCAGAGAGAPPDTRLGWLVPPALRAVEYGLLLRLAVLADEPLPLSYAFLAVLAYHHYDLMYRRKSRGVAPPRWLRLAAGGWDLRLVAGYALLLAGKLGPGMVVGGTALGALFLTESVRSWTGGAGPVGADGTDDGRRLASARYHDDEADEE